MLLRVDEVLIRALTAGVRGHRVTLGFDWAPGNLAEPEGTKTGWQRRATARWHGWFLSVSAHSMLFHARTYTHIHTHIWLSTTHKQKTEVCYYKAGRAYCAVKPAHALQPSSPLPQNLKTTELALITLLFPAWGVWRCLENNEGYQSAVCVVVYERIKTGMLYWAFIGSPSPHCALLDLLPSA